MDRDALIAAMEATAAIAPTPVKVKGWGTVHVRAITVAEVETQAEDTADKEDKDRIARAAARVLCDENGKRLFDPNNEADVALIKKQPWPLLRKVMNASGSQFGDDPGN